MIMRGRTISKGRAEGVVLATREPLSFLGGIDPETGVVIEKGHELEGKSVRGKILVFPWGKGSTVGTYALYQMKRKGTAPAGIVNTKAEGVVAVGAIISGIPMIDSLDGNPLALQGKRVYMDADEGYLEVRG